MKLPIFFLPFNRVNWALNPGFFSLYESPVPLRTISAYQTIFSPSYTYTIASSVRAYKYIVHPFLLFENDLKLFLSRNPLLREYYYDVYVRARIAEWRIWCGISYIYFIFCVCNIKVIEWQKKNILNITRIWSKYITLCMQGFYIFLLFVYSLGLNAMHLIYLYK